MNNPWVIGIGASLTACLIWYLLGKCIHFAVSASASTPHDWRVWLFAVVSSMVLFVFGNILQPAVQWFLEPGNPKWTLIGVAREQLPGLTLFLLFVSAALPGIVTGSICVRGRTLGQRIGFAMVAAVVSLSVLDALAFFPLRSYFVDSPYPEMQAAVQMGNFYFSLISNITGGAIAGLVVGAATNFFTQFIEDRGVPPKN